MTILSRVDRTSVGAPGCKGLPAHMNDCAAEYSECVPADSYLRETTMSFPSSAGEAQGMVSEVAVPESRTVATPASSRYLVWYLLAPVTELQVTTIPVPDVKLLQVTGAGAVRPVRKRLGVPSHKAIKMVEEAMAARNK